MGQGRKEQMADVSNEVGELRDEVDFETQAIFKQPVVMLRNRLVIAHSIVEIKIIYFIMEGKRSRLGNKTHNMVYRGRVMVIMPLEVIIRNGYSLAIIIHLSLVV